MDLAGKKYWVIGASAGIGEALAAELSRRGASLALSARNREKLEAIKTSLGREETLVLPLDVTARPALTTAVETLLREWGAIDGMIFVAGVYTPMHATAIDEAEALNTFNINFIGGFMAVAAVIPTLLKQGGGHIVLFSSVAGFRGLPNSLVYGASKAALTNFAETLYLDLSPKGIAVQVVHPGFVKTRLTDKNPFEMPFIITPEEAARRVANGMEKGGFEIHFPRRFTGFMKFLRVLPYPVYFWLTQKLLRL